MPKVGTDRRIIASPQAMGIREVGVVIHPVIQLTGQAMGQAMINVTANGQGRKNDVCGR